MNYLSRNIYLLTPPVKSLMYFLNTNALFCKSNQSLPLVITPWLVTSSLPVTLRQWVSSEHGRFCTVPYLFNFGFLELFQRQLDFVCFDLCLDVFLQKSQGEKVQKYVIYVKPHWVQRPFFESWTQFGCWLYLTSKWLTIDGLVLWGGGRGERDEGVAMGVLTVKLLSGEGGTAWEGTGSQLRPSGAGGRCEGAGFISFFSDDSFSSVALISAIKPDIKASKSVSSSSFRDSANRVQKGCGTWTMSTLTSVCHDSTTLQNCLVWEMGEVCIIGW